MTVERTFDLALIRALALSCWDEVRDDFSPDRDQYQPPDGYYLVAREGDAILGFALFVPHNWVRWEIHLVMRAKGKQALAAVRQMFNFVFETTSCRRIIAAIPAHNRKCILFARWMGMEPVGIDRAAFLKSGVLEDLVLFGISKP